MSNTRIISDIQYKRRFYKLGGECMMRSISSKDTNIKAVTNTNCALVGTFINVFKDSTQIDRSGISSKNNIASNESERSTLVNKVISYDRCILKDNAGNICFGPAFQDSSKICSDNGSSPLCDASISTSTSTISDGNVVCPVIIEERSENATVDERSGNAIVDERSGNATVDERSGNATVDERSGNTTVEERSGNATVEERSGNATVDERSGNAVADQVSGISVGDQRIGIAAGDERNAITAVVYERSGTQSVVYGRVGAAAVNNGRTTIPNFSGGKTESYKSQIKICKEMNEKVTRVNMSINKYCHSPKCLRSSQLNKDGNLDHKMNSENISDLEKFIETINLANSDMVRKSGKLLQKLYLVNEMLSYIQATQSVCRLSVPKNMFGGDISSDENQSINFNSNKNFHSAGEYILDELQLFLRHLKADFKDWEAKRLTILRISESIPRQFELCYSNYSTRVLMHNISAKICTILQEMNDINSKREERDVELNEIGNSIDRYIRFSSSFIKDKYPSNRLF